jgi:hypothetical protein
MQLPLAPTRRVVKKVDAPGLDLGLGLGSGSGSGELVRRGSGRGVCLVCTKAAAPYVCPRCLAPYCSKECYSTHGGRCTEGFYRGRVEAERDVSDERGAREVNEMIRRVRGGSASGWETGSGSEGNVSQETPAVLSPEELDRLAAALEKMEGSGAEVEDFSTLLTERQLKLFERAVASGTLSHQVQVRKPWWQGPLVEEVEPCPERDREGCGRHEGALFLTISNPCKIHLPSFSSIHPGSVSPALPFLVMDVLLSYVATVRLYNGCWCPDPEGAAAALLGTSCVLSCQAVPSAAAAAISSFVETCARLWGPPAAMSALPDAAKICRREGWPSAALCDAVDMFEAAGTQARKGSKRGKSASAFFTAGQRRLHFFAVWCQGQEHLLLEPLEEACTSASFEIEREDGLMRVAH